MLRMKTTAIESVSEILDTFDLIEITDLLERQINLSDGNIIDRNTDYFKPLYFKYKSIMDDEDNPDDIKEETRQKFMNVCHIFINIIAKYFNLSIDQEWINDNEGDLPALVTALYCFFVKDIVSNLQEVCINYINKNKKDIFTLFEDRKNKKDCVTIVSKRNYTIETAVIVSNIYDVATWILSQMSENKYIMYMNQDYAPLIVVDKLLEDGIIAGEFMESINNAFAENLPLKAEVCFQLLSIIEKDK